MGHMFLAPSSAHIWGEPGGCRAAPRIQALYPESEDSPAAREGTAAHEMSAEGLARALRALPLPSEWVGRMASNGEVFTAEMLDACQVYADDVRAEAIARGVFGGEAVGIEQNMMLPRIHAMNGGTPDFWMHDQRNRTLLVWDFKYGHDDVEAFENWQLINYAALILDHLGINGATEQGYTVVMKVVQPRSFKRSGPVDTWKVPASGLRPYWNDLAAGAVESMAPDAPARPGRHCKHCSGRHACDALRFAAGAMMDYARTATVQNMPAQALALESGWLEDAGALIDARLSGLREEIDAKLSAGEVVPGYARQQDYGRTAWKDPQQVIGIGAAFGLDLRKNEPLTPAQAKKAGLPDDVLKQFSHKPAKGFKLTRVKSNEAKKVFSQ